MTPFGSAAPSSVPTQTGAQMQPEAAGGTPPPVAPPAAPRPPRPPTSREVFDEAVKMLRSDRMRAYRIDIETDQMVLDDREKDRQDRISLVTAVGGFMQQALPAIQMYPQAAGVLVELLQFALRGWNTGRTLEAAFEEAGDQLMQSKANPQQQQQDPRAATDQARLAIEQQKAQTLQGKAQADIGIQTQKAQSDAALRSQELALREREVAALEAKTLAEAQARQVQVSSTAQIQAGDLQRKKEEGTQALLLEVQRLAAEVQLERQRIDAIMAGKMMHAAPQAAVPAG